MSRKHKKDNRGVVQSFAMILQFGISMIVPIAICVALGIFLGKKFDMSWLVIPFFFLGALAGGTGVYRMAKAIFEDKK